MFAVHTANRVCGRFCVLFVIRNDTTDHTCHRGRCKSQGYRLLGDRSNSLKEPVAAIAWTGVLVFDGVIFLLTLYKAFTIGTGVKLLYVIVRDGASNLIIH